MRFTITSTHPNGSLPFVRYTDSVVEAWDWYAYFTKKYPGHDVQIIDAEAEVRA